MRGEGTSDFVGRWDEATELERVWRSVCRGEGPAGVLVQGAAGVGKSRLVERVAAGLLTAPDVLMVGHCVDLYGDDMPYGGAADAIRDLIRRRGVQAARDWSGPFASALASLIPDIDPAVTQIGPGRLLEGFAALLDNAASDRPVWLWVEDLQWSDRATRALVSWVIRTVRAPHLMVTCTLRTHEQATPYEVVDFWSELRRLPHVTAIDVQPFDRRAVADQWQALTRRRPSAALADRVRDLSGGLPFYVGLLAASGWTADRPVPVSLRELAGSPLGRLGPAALRVVQAASVEDGRLPHQVLRDVVGTDTDVDGGIAQAVDAGVLSPEDRGDGYRFRHALIREAAVDSLLPPQEARWHARWAARLEQAAALGEDPFAQIAAAHHWVRADDPTRAFDAALAAADLAGRILALDEEARLLREALELWPRVDHAEERTGYTRSDLLRSVLVTLALVPDPPALLRVIDRELATPQDDPVPELLLRDLRRRFETADEAGDSQPAAADRAAADLLLNTPLDHPWLARVAVGVSCLFEREAPALSERLLEHASASARCLAGRPSGRHAYLPMTPAVDVVVTACVLAGLRIATGDVEAAVRIVRGLPGDVELRQIASHVDWYLAEAEWMLGHYREAVTAAELALERVVEPHRAPLLWGGLIAQLAESQLALGCWDDAEHSLAHCEEVLLDDGEASQALALAGVLAAWRGRPNDAAAVLQRVQAAPTPDPLAAALVRPRWLAAELAASRQDVVRLRQELDPLWLEDGWQVASSYLWQPLLLELRIEVDLVLAAGAGVEVAWERVRLCAEVARRLYRIGDAGVAWHQHLQAELRLAEGSNDPSAWEAVCASWSKIGRVHDRAWARLRQAGALASSRQREEALVCVDDVRRVAADLGAVPLAEAAGALAIRVRGVGRRGDGAAGGLTRREKEVLALLALGRSNGQIAAELFISPKTVSVHVSAVLGKLHSSSRSEAVATAQRTGVLAIPAQR